VGWSGLWRAIESHAAFAAASVAASLAFGLAIIGSHATSASSEPSPVPVEFTEKAWALCRRLEAARVARNCADAGRTLESESFTVRFDPVEDAPAEGAVTVFLSERAARADAVERAEVPSEDVPADDYPMLHAASKPREGAGWRITWTTARWQACRAARSVAACEKLYSDEYANAQRLSKVATEIAEGAGAAL
jgi:hypothetical protein